MTNRAAIASALALALATSSLAACGGSPDASPASANGGRDSELSSAPLPGDGTNGTRPSSASGGAGGSGQGGAPGTTSGSGGEGTDADPGAPLSKERALAQKLGLGSRFAIGLGNDSEGNSPDQVSAFTLGPKLDIHYMYLSGLDWPEWNLPAGNYVTMHANAAKARGVVPMFTLYQAASYGENNLSAFNTTDFMTKYWRGVRIMFQKLGAFGSPAIVHVEPDLWGYTQKKGDDPAAVPMKVGSLVPECTDLPSNVAGMAKCVIRLARALSPNVAVGLSASAFGAFTNGASDPVRIGAYMNAIGANEADLLVLETLDRDAGCFEKGTDPNCQRSGSFYWDETNTAHPNFHDHLAWAKTLRTTVGLPLLWWQMPLGRPAAASGGAGAYRDNRVKYLFAHPGEFAAAGGIGAVFGTGAPNQTTARTDGNQFKNALTSYLTTPAPLL